METLQAITTRRSIRKYTGEPIAEETIHTLLAAAMSGPSTGNQQPWQFVVVTEQAMLKRLAAVPAYKMMLETAPLAVVVCADKTLSRWGEHWIVDCAIATQNLLLAAHDQGLGAVWLGCYWLDDRLPGVVEALQLPEHIIPFSVVTLGVPAQTLKAGERYQAERVHRDRWQQ